MWRRDSFRNVVLVSAAAVAVVWGAVTAFGDDSRSILKQLKNINVVASTVPANGDLNPWYRCFITEITPRGKQLAKVLLDNTGGPPPGNGTLFGVTFDPLRGVLFVDDGSNTLNSLN
jgi:hypothetical protein